MNLAFQLGKVPAPVDRGETEQCHLLVHKPETRRGTAAVFGEQFPDDVRLAFKPQPALPVRVARL